MNCSAVSTKNVHRKMKMKNAVAIVYSFMFMW